MRRRLSGVLGLISAFLLACSVGAQAQIVNRLKVDDVVFQRYAFGRMQEFNEANLVLADSIYAVGTGQNGFKYKCLGLSLEIPVRFVQGNYDRMDEAMAEIKQLVGDRREFRSFYFSTLHEYCEFLVHIGRSSDAMLEARAMERTASQEHQPIGKMYSYRILALIQSYRDNPFLAIRNFEKAVKYCKEARAEQDLPNMYILTAQEFIKMRNFPEAEEYCVKAEAYQDFFPSIRVKARMTRAYLYNAEQDWTRFWECYDALISDPLYRMQVDGDARYGMDVYYLISKERFQDALSKADSLSTARERYDKKHGIYAALGSYDNAYDQLAHLMNEKDSVYIKVQNEDLAILDAEMNNAQLRQDAERLKHQNQNTILIGFLVMFAIAFFAILLSQWQLRENLEAMRRKNSETLAARRTFQKAMDAKEAENDYKIKILQNRTTNVLTDYEDFLNI